MDWSQLWRVLHTVVDKIGKVFIKLGIEQHELLPALINSLDTCRHILEISKATILVVDDDSRLEKINKIKGGLPHLKAVISISSSSSNHYC